MCNCNGGDMRPDRIFPPTGSTGIDGGLPTYQPGGFGNVLIGNPRKDPTSGLPPIRVQVAMETAASMVPSGATPGDPGAGAGLATSSSTSPVADAAKEHWPWLLVIALVGAALWVKA